MQTFMQHRYAAHAAFSMNKFWERFFYIFTYITQGSSYVSPRAYAIMHRMHHAYTDTEMDPHSPKFDDSIFKMMWRTRQIAAGIYDETHKVEPRFMKNVPDWPLMDRIANSVVSRLGWIAIYVAIYAIYAPSAWWYLLLPVHIAMVPVHGMIINWFAHKYGSKNFELKNTSTNLFKVDIFMMGEGYHNNHHKSPSSTNFGFKWYELDPTYLMIKFLSWARVIKVNKLKPVPVAVNQQQHQQAVHSQ
jgi:stearoyl-CoA desaturase (delta-9 desaturase)